MINHKIDEINSAFDLLRDCICVSHEWKKEDVKIEVITTNLKTGERDYRSWKHLSLKSPN